MRILGIETSCDETAASIVEDGTKILSNVVASSVELHQKTGGIIPEVAAREQVKYIIPVIEKTIENCKLKIENLTALAVTYGPGLIGSLLVGIETAKTLSYLWKKPIIPVNHLLAHIYANWLDRKKLPEFPAVVLIASGGHTELVLMKNHGDFTWLGGTRDDAAGEAFDKIARLLGLGYPGGPAIEACAAKLRNCEIKFPRPMINEDSLDFSFSGLKTAVLRKVKEYETTKKLNSQITKQLAFETQEAITDVLVAKTIKAAKQYKVKSILISGGVAANERLREKFKSEIRKLRNYKIEFHAPLPNLSTDNAAAITSCAFFNFQPIPWQKITAQSSLGIDEEKF